MSDDLIERVAKRLGWIYDSGVTLWRHKALGAKTREEFNKMTTAWLTSVDACLKLLDDVGYAIHSWPEIPHLKQIKNYEVHYTGIEVRNKSLPRAILEAFLQSPKAKP